MYICKDVRNMILFNVRVPKEEFKREGVVTKVKIAIRIWYYD